MCTGTASAQLIDTIRDPYLTKSDSTNYLMRSLRGFTVHILKPEIINKQGYKVKNGFDTYYIHVIATREVYIDSVPFPLDTQRTYFAISSMDKKLKFEGDTLTSRALFLKGIVVGDSTGREKRDTKRAVKDSLKAQKGQSDSLDADIEATRSALKQQQRQAAEDSSKAKREKDEGFKGIRLFGGKNTDGGKLAVDDTTQQAGTKSKRNRRKKDTSMSTDSLGTDSTAADSLARDTTPDPYPNAKGKVKEWLLKSDMYKHMADSVQTRIDSTFMPESEMYEFRDILIYNSGEAFLAAQAYADLEKAGTGPGLGKFFTTHHFSRSERFHVLSHPYGLPEYTSPKPQPAYTGRATISEPTGPVQSFFGVSGASGGGTKKQKAVKKPKKDKKKKEEPAKPK